MIGPNVTRNAVLAKADRLGLLGTRAPASKPSRAEKITPPKAKAPPPANHKNGLNFRNPAKPQLAVAETGQIFEKAREAVEPPVSARAWDPLPGSQPIPFPSLGNPHCKWPIDLPGATDHHACGLKRSGEGPYCEAHADRARGATPRVAPKELARSLRRFAA